MQLIPAHLTKSTIPRALQPLPRQLGRFDPADRQNSRARWRVAPTLRLSSARREVVRECLNDSRLRVEVAQARKRRI
jgi:hypothetical protein